MHGQQNIKFSIFFSVINEIYAHFFCFTIRFISCLYIFRAHVLIISKSKLHYTASGQQNIKKRKLNSGISCYLAFWNPGVAGGGRFSE